MIALMGYLFGCSNLAFFLGKARGFDIRDHGSNNAGASNATVTMGLKIGFLVGL
ncbi:MAG: glycerol-3-phosphate acyltransferase, partial [Oscillospiraceae bacterium]|nr:glycerol-3-phosphate acyltransferase [Oscillospiraceae bacterium]